LLIAAMIGLVASFTVRHRLGDAVMHAQLRWVEFAVVILVLGSVPFILARYVINVGEAMGELSVALAEISSLALPIAAAMAITRRHLFGIDRLINRTLVYASLIGVLGGLYAAVVWLFQRLFVSVTGEVSEAPLFFAVFLIAAAFTPVRKSLDGMVDRWARAPQSAEGDTAEDAPAPPDDTGNAASDTRVTAIGAAIAPPDLSDPEVLRVAAAVLAVRRFEARFGDPDGRAPVASTTLASAATVAGDQASVSLAIGADGRVPCPMQGAEQSVTLCLGCPHLRALQTAPPVVRCGFASAVVAGA
jgi:hypothetical protein